MQLPQSQKEGGKVKSRSDRTSLDFWIDFCCLIQLKTCNNLTLLLLHMIQPEYRHCSPTNLVHKMALFVSSSSSVVCFRLSHSKDLAFVSSTLLFDVLPFMLKLSSSVSLSVFDFGDL